MDNRVQQLGSQALLTFVKQVLVMLVNVVFVSLIARWLGPEKNGVYALFLLVSLTTATLLQFGLPTSNIYFISKQEFHAKLVLQKSLVFWLILSLVGLPIAFTFYFTVYQEDLAEYRQVFTLSLAGFTLLTYLLDGILLSILQGMKRFREFNNQRLIQASVSTLTLVLFYLFTPEFTVQLALLSYLGGFLVSNLLSIFLIRRHSSGLPPIQNKEPYGPKAFSFGLKNHINNVLAFLNYRLDLFIISFIVGPAAVGVYNLCVRLIERIWIISQSVNAVALPNLVEIQKNEEARKQLAPALAKWVFLATLLPSIVVFFLAEPIVLLFFGKEYLDGVVVIQWLMPGILMGSYSKVLSNDIAARGKPLVNTYQSIGVLVFNGTLNLILTPRFGLAGAAAATSFTYILNAVVKSVVYARIAEIPWAKLFAYSDPDREMTGWLKAKWQGLKAKF